MNVVDVRGIPIHYEEFGSGRPIVFIHGVATDHRHLVAENEPVFEGRPGWRRLYPDLPGRGQTPGADWITSQDDILAVTLELLDALAPGEHFAALGASWGGYIVLGLLHERGAQMDGVALIVSNPLRTGRTTPEHRAIVPASPEVRASLAESEREWLDWAVVQTAENLQIDRELFQPMAADADMPFIERVEERTTFSFDVRELPPFDRPSVILSGRQDAMAGYLDMLAMIETFPRATVAILDRAGHNVAHEQRILSRALVGEWLDRIEAETGPTG